MTSFQLNGFTILFDKEDQAIVQGHRWHVLPDGRAQASTYDPATQRTGKVRLHRLVMERMVGRSITPKEEVDHVNGNPSDNRRKNLRLATHQQNLSNHGRHRGSSSSYIGVYLIEGRTGWSAGVSRDDKFFYVGHFESETDAAWMRDQWAMALHGEFARLNFNYEVLL
jgi:hypothetical protein